MAIRGLDFTAVREIVLRATSGSFSKKRCTGAKRHRKTKGTRGGYALDVGEQLAPLSELDFIPVET
jgi:hypothetical protein